jgi:putative hydrolase of the HAD superfamily
MNRHSRAVLFDAAGTLIDPCPPIAEIYAQAGSAGGSRLTVAEIDSRFHAARRNCLAARPTMRTDQNSEFAFWFEVVRYVFHDVPDCQSIFDRLWDHFAAPHSWRLFDDVAETLTSLVESGMVVGIASNFDDRLLALYEHIERWCPRSLVFYSARLGHRKPSADFFAAIQSQLGTSADRIWMVGDDLQADVQGAREAGWNAVHIRREDKVGTASVDGRFETSDWRSANPASRLPMPGRATGAYSIVTLRELPALLGRHPVGD